MQNNNETAPMGQITGKVNLNEVSGGNYTKRSDVAMLNHGVNLGVIYGFIDLGTHMESFKGEPAKEQRKLKIQFEHPQLKQLFYEEDTVPRSTASSKDCTFSINEKSFLKLLIDAVLSKTLTVQQAIDYDVAELIGKRVGVSIVHQPKKDNPTVFYEKVSGVVSPNGLQVPHPFEPENKPLFFYIDKQGNNFMTQNFADLPKYFRDTIKKSKEGIAHANRGGKFAENPKQEQGQGQQFQQQPKQPQQPQQNNAIQEPITMTASAQFTRAQYHASGWSDQQLIDSGLAIANKVVEAPPVAFAPPPVPAAAPAPVQQQQQQVPVVPTLVPTASAQYTREQYQASGWTDDQLIQQGLFVWNTPVSAPAAAPQTPQAPQGPQGPPAPQANNTPTSFLSGGNSEEHDDLPF